uniref:Uncharacterized protein n=1 Tax=Anguilla anguilla TaxID=7936 RepID=A0A0E9PDJ2_ANGAN
MQPPQSTLPSPTWLSQNLSPLTFVHPGQHTIKIFFKEYKQIINFNGQTVILRQTGI